RVVFIHELFRLLLLAFAGERRKLVELLGVQLVDELLRGGPGVSRVSTQHHEEHDDQPDDHDETDAAAEDPRQRGLLGRLAAVVRTVRTGGTGLLLVRRLVEPGLRTALRELPAGRGAETGLGRLPAGRELPAWLRTALRELPAGLRRLWRIRQGSSFPPLERFVVVLFCVVARAHWSRSQTFHSPFSTVRPMT